MATLTGKLGPSRLEKRLDLLTRAGLLIILFLAPLPFGSVEPGAFSALEMAVAAVALLYLYRLFLFPSTPVRFSSLLLPPIGFLALMALQLVPLPPPLLRAVSPKTAALYAQTIPGYGDSSRGIAAEEAALAGSPSPKEAGWLPVSQSPQATWTYLLKAAALTLFLFLLLNSFQRPESRRSLFITLAAAGTFQAFYGLLEYLSGHQHIFTYQKKYYTDAATGTFINRNHFAGFLEMTLLLILGLLFSKLREPQAARGWRERILSFTDRRASLNLTLLLCIAIIIVALVLSYSRAGIILGLSAAAAFCLSQARHEWSGKKMALVVLLAAVVLIPAYGVGYWQLTGRYAILTQELTTPGGRLTVWQKTAEIFRDFPVLGTGVGTFQYVFPRYRAASVTAFYDYAHNDYLQVLSESGVPGALLMIWGIVLVARLALRRSPPGSAEGILRVAGGFGLLAIGLHEWVDFGLQIPANTLFLTALVGCVALVAGTESRIPAMAEPRHA